MNCIIPGANIKIISRTLQALSRIGDELYIEAQKEYLQFAAINMNKTVYATYHFFHSFFSDYNVSLDSAKEDDRITCKVHLKAMLNVFKWKGPKDKEKKIEFCRIELEKDPTRIIIKLKYKQGSTIIHSLKLIDTEFVTVSYSKDDLLNQIGTLGHFLTQVLSNFQLGDDDMNLDVDNTKITIRNYDNGSAVVSKHIRSQVVLNSNEFTTYTINQVTNVTMSFKSFRAAVQFAEHFDLSIILNFDIGGRPVVLTMRTPTFEVDFVLSTINPENLTQSSTVSSALALTKKSVQVQHNSSLSKEDRLLIDSINWEDNDFNPNVNVNEPNNQNIDPNGLNLQNDGNISMIPSDSPKAKKVRLIFGRCYDTTFSTSMLDFGEKLANNSDSESEL